MTSQPDSVASDLMARIRAAIAEAGGWLPFDRFMALALYAPGLGYYANERRKFGLMPASGSDFVTAPELSPLFGRALAAQVAEALVASDTRQVYEFGAGSGALAEQLLDALDARGLRVDYAIIDLSGTLQARQAVDVEGARQAGLVHDLSLRAAGRVELAHVGDLRLLRVAERRLDAAGLGVFLLQAGHGDLERTLRGVVVHAPILVPGRRGGIIAG
ncbi:MAG: SAM-dependent methyltransferase [Burkholderiales bacterium]|nr:SAM-dependent methyltransferase [Burkholderiales bacterium]